MSSLEKIANDLNCELEVVTSQAGKTFFASVTIGDYSPVEFITEITYFNRSGLGWAYASSEADAILSALQDLAEKISGRPMVKYLCGDVEYVCPKII